MGLPVLTLQQQQTIPSIRAKLLGYLTAKGTPVTSWADGDVERTLTEAEISALFDLVTSAIPSVVNGSFVDYATFDWLTLNAKQRYNKDRLLATFAQGTIRLTNSTGSPIAVTTSQLWFKFPSGNLYQGPIGTGPFSIPAGGFLDITVQSQSVNHSVATSPTDTSPLVSYNDASSSAITMVTALAGVTATNPAPLYSGVALVGTSTGTLALSGTPAPSHSIILRVDTNGQAGACSYSYSLDGAAYVTGLTAAAQSNIGGFGIGWTLTNGSGTPSFVAGDTFTFSTPGNWITQQGTDQETDAALQSRCKGSWPSLATLTAIPGSPTLGFYDLLARQPIAPATTSQVTQTLIQTDPVVNNQVNIIVAGTAGILPDAVITALRGQFNKLNMLTDRPVVQSPTPLTIVIGGLTITVTQNLMATAQAALQATLQTYFNSVGINGAMVGGKIKHGKLVQLVEDTVGVVDLSDTAMTINGVIGSLTMPTVANAFQLAVWTQAVASAFTWVIAS